MIMPTPADTCNSLHTRRHKPKKPSPLNKVAPYPNKDVGSHADQSRSILLIPPGRGIYVLTGFLLHPGGSPTWLTASGCDSCRCIPPRRLYRQAYASGGEEDLSTRPNHLVVALAFSSHIGTASFQVAHRVHRCLPRGYPKAERSRCQLP